ncbi:MAG: phage holin family protein [Microgenomates group bacterium]
MSILIKILINAFAIYLTAYFLSEGVKIKDFYAAIVVYLTLSLVNTFLKPILKILFLPLNLLTLGLFNFILNGILILFIAYFVPGFYVKDIVWAVTFSVILSIVNWFLHLLTR